MTWNPTWSNCQPAPSSRSKNLTASTQRSSASQYLLNNQQNNSIWALLSLPCLATFSRLIIQRNSKCCCKRNSIIEQNKVLRGQKHKWVIHRISQRMTIPSTRLTHLLAGCTYIKPKCGLQQSLQLYHENDKNEFTSVRKTSPCCHEKQESTWIEH